MNDGWFHEARGLSISSMRKLSQICDSVYSTGKFLALVPRLLIFSPKVYAFCSEHKQSGMDHQKLSDDCKQLRLNSPFPSLFTKPYSVGRFKSQPRQCQPRTEGCSSWLDAKEEMQPVILDSLFLLLECFLKYFAGLGNRCFIVIGNFHMIKVWSSLSSQVSSKRLCQYIKSPAHFCILFCDLATFYTHLRDTLF